MVHAAWGGSMIEWWMRYDALESNAGGQADPRSLGQGDGRLAAKESEIRKGNGGLERQPQS